MRRHAIVLAITSLCLASLLPLLVPLDAQRNIDLQGIVLIQAGALALISLLMQRNAWPKQPSLAVVLLGVFIAACVLSLLVNPQHHDNLLGSVYLRLGSLGLLSCIACALCSLQFTARTIRNYLYGGIIVVALLSVPYSLAQAGTVDRIGGLFNQPDIFACVLGLGILLGFEMMRNYPRHISWLAGAQFLLFGLLLTTQTRAAIGLVIVISLVQVAMNYKTKRLLRLSLYSVVTLLLVFGLLHILPSRLTDTTYISESIAYRVDLQSAALSMSQEKALLGYGAGSLSTALDCKNLHAETLQTTCKDGHYFNSSHNIFLDRILAFGWFGGLSFIALIILAIYRGLRGPQEERVFAYCTILIAGYYCTNVTSVSLELLLWVMVLRCLFIGRGRL